MSGIFCTPCQFGSCHRCEGCTCAHDNHGWDDLNARAMEIISCPDCIVLGYYGVIYCDRHRIGDAGAHDVPTTPVRQSPSTPQGDE